jgi:hypothetical protein
MEYEYYAYPEWYDDDDDHGDNNDDREEMMRTNEQAEMIDPRIKVFVELLKNGTLRQIQLFLAFNADFNVNFILISTKSRKMRGEYYLYHINLTPFTFITLSEKDDDKLEIMKLLIKHGADVNFPESSLNVLFKRLYGSHYSKIIYVYIIQMLLENNVIVNEETICLFAKLRKRKIFIDMLAVLLNYGINFNVVCGDVVISDFISEELEILSRSAKSARMLAIGRKKSKKRH